MVNLSSILVLRKNSNIAVNRNKSCAKLAIPRLPTPIFIRVTSQKWSAQQGSVFCGINAGNSENPGLLAQKSRHGTSKVNGIPWGAVQRTSSRVRIAPIHQGGWVPAPLWPLHEVADFIVHSGLLQRAKTPLWEGWEASEWSTDPN